MYSYMVDNGEKGSPAPYYDFDGVRERILSRGPEETAKLAGVSFDAQKSEFTLESLGQKISVSYPECRARFAETGEKPVLVWHLAILHYLATANGAPLSDKLAPFRDMDKHVPHPQIFEETTSSALVKHFADKPLKNLEEMCVALGADIGKVNADLYAVFKFLPKFPIVVRMWLNDDEMPGSAGLLFNVRGTCYLPLEDIDFIGDLLVKFMIEQYDLMFAG